MRVIFTIVAVLLLLPGVIADPGDGHAPPENSEAGRSPQHDSNHTEAQEHEESAIEANIGREGPLPPYCDPWLGIITHPPGSNPPVSILFRPECLIP